MMPPRILVSRFISIRFPLLMPGEQVEMSFLSAAFSSRARTLGQLALPGLHHDSVFGVSYTMLDVGVLPSVKADFEDVE